MMMILSSCSQNVWVLKKSRLYDHAIIENPSTGDRDDNYYRKVPKKIFKAKLKDKDSYIVITPKEKKDKVVSGKETVLPPSKMENFEMQEAVKRSLEGENLVFPSVGAKDTNGPKGFHYFDSGILLKGLTIPIKYRPGLPEYSTTAIDSFPNQLETGVNLGFAGGVRLSYNFYNPNTKLEANKVLRLSVVPGAFLGLGSTTISRSNTRMPQLGKEDVSRKVGTISGGVFLMFGVNRVHFGYATGADWVLGKWSTGWVYNGKRWHGLILGLDLIK